ncbi:MAG: clostripain-related cysteine peptidase [Pirellulaceae bacterium]
MLIIRYPKVGSSSELVDGAAGDSSHSVRLGYDATSSDLEMSIVDSAGQVLHDAQSQPLSSRSRSGVERISLDGFSASEGPFWIRIIQRGSADTRADFSLQLILPAAEPSDWSEPNPDAGSAYSLGTLSGNVTMSDLSLDTSSDVDWFSFDQVDVSQFLSDHQITVRGGSDEDNFTIGLYDANDPSQAVLQTTSVGGVATIHMEEVVTVAEQWLLKVEGMVAGNYAIQLQLPSMYDPDWAEPHGSDSNNDAIERAYDLGVVNGSLALGDLSLDHGGDIDYFRFNISSPMQAGSFLAATTIEADSEGVVELLNEDNQVVASMEMSADGSNILALDILTVGVYFARVRGQNADALSYQLLLLDTGSVLPDRAEGNNRPSDAYLIDSTVRCSGVNPYSCGIGANRVQWNASGSQAFSDAVNAAYISDLRAQGKLPPVNPAVQFVQAFGQVVQTFVAAYQFVSSIRQLGNSTSSTFSQPAEQPSSTRLIDIPSNSQPVYRPSVQTNGSSDTASKDGPSQTDLALAILSLLQNRTPGITVRPIETDSRNTFADPVDVRSLPSNALLPVSSTYISPVMSLHEEDDIDWYRFSLDDSADSSQQVRVQSLSDTVVLTAKLFDADETLDGTEIASVTSYGSQSILPLAGLSAGEYLIRIDGESKGLYQFEIDLSAEVDYVPDWAEPNDDASVAKLLPESESLQAFADLSLDDASDADWFQVTLESDGNETDFVGISFDANQSDVDLQLFAAGDTAGQPLRTSENRDAAIESISLDGLAAGDYLIHVFSSDLRPAAEYVLTTKLPSTSVPSDRFEPNDRKVQAIDIDEFGRISRLTQLTLGESDVDLFSFTLPTDAQPGHQFRAVGPGLTLRLLDTTGLEIGRAISDGSETVLSLADTEAGDFLVEVSSDQRVRGYSIDWDLPVGDQAVDRWTFLVYMTASDLERYAEADINELEIAAAGLPADVNLLVMLDQSDGFVRDTRGGFREAYSFATGDQQAWGDAGYAIVQRDLDSARIATRFQRIGERNSGDPGTLTDFIRWGRTIAPAERYGLIMWDHGSGLDGTNRDEESAGDLLTTDELIAAIDGVASDFELDLLFFDACLMATAEVSTALRGSARYVIASQENIAGRGLDYRSAFAPLQAVGGGRDIEARTLASSIVQSYTEQYVGRYTTDTLSVVETSAMSQVTAALRDLVEQSLNLDESGLQSLRNAIERSPVYGGEANGLRDLRGFVDEVIRTASNSDIRDAATDVRDAVDIVVQQKTIDHRSSGGLSILLPSVGQARELNRYIEDYRSEHAGFVSATRWDELLERLITQQHSPSDRIDWASNHSRSERPFDLGTISGSLSLPEFELADISTRSAERWFEFDLDQAGTQADSIKLHTAGAAYSVQLFRLRSGGQPLLIHETQVIEGTEATINFDGLTAGGYQLRLALSVAGEGESPALASTARAKISWQTGITPEQTSVGNRTESKAELLGSTVDTFLRSDLIATSVAQYFELVSPRLPGRESRTLELRSHEIPGLTTQLKVIESGDAGATVTSIGTIDPTTVDGSLSWQLPAGNGIRFVLEVASSVRPQRFSLGLTDRGGQLVSWQNPRNRLDVNNGGTVTPLDALIVLNRLARQGTHLPWISTHPDRYYDTSGDGILTPLDALIILNGLAKLSFGGEGEDWGTNDVVSRQRDGDSLSNVAPWSFESDDDDDDVDETWILDSLFSTWPI